MRNVYIINPKAGKHDHTVQFMERIRAVHATHGEKPEIYLTQRAGHGEELARAAAEKGDALLRAYAQTLIEYIEYYLRFEGAQGDMVSGIIDEKLDQLGDVYYLASYAGRREVLAELNTYYRSLGVSEENLIDAGDKPQQPDSARLRSGI